MRAGFQEFLENLPLLLRLLAEPITGCTESEVFHRIDAWGWNECFPTLLEQLESGDSDVKCLVLSVICYATTVSDLEVTQPLESAVLSLLVDESSCVRMSAIVAAESLGTRDPQIIATLRRIVGHDNDVLSCQALITLLEHDIDRSVLRDIKPLFRNESN